MKNKENMNFNVSKFQFACEIFGAKNIDSMNSLVIQNFYNDWKSTGLCLDIYKSLLRTRG